MKYAVTLLDEADTIDLDRPDFYEAMLEAIVTQVFALLGPEFDKQGFLDEVEGGRSALEIGQELAIPATMLLSLELGYCLGQLRMLGRSLDSEKALEDLYNIWKTRLKAMLREEMITRGLLH